VWRASCKASSPGLWMQTTAGKKPCCDTLVELGLKLEIKWSHAQCTANSLADSELVPSVEQSAAQGTHSVMVFELWPQNPGFLNLSTFQRACFGSGVGKWDLGICVHQVQAFPEERLHFFKPRSGISLVGCLGDKMHCFVPSKC
jgi:hypothetical protein